MTAIDEKLLEMERAAAKVEPENRSASSLLAEVRLWIRRFVVLSPHETLAVALWVLLTHALKIADCVPYLAISSPEKGSGKTRLLEALEPIVARPWLTGRVSPAVLARKIDKEQPTLLLDESDATFRGDKEYAETLRGVLNTGYLRSGKTSLCVTKGKTIEYVDLSTFGPKAIAGIGELPDTVADRSIPIRLQRRLASEPVERFRRKRIEPEADNLRDRLVTWGSAFETQAQGQPEPPGLDDLPDRAADIWEPLLVISDAYGAEVALEARDAARALCGGAREDQSLGVRTLRDIKVIFDASHRERMASAEIVRRLLALEDPAYGPRFGRDFDARTLAERLRPFGIRPGTVRLDRGRTPKGYHGDDFKDAWNRYLSPSGEAQQPQPAPQGHQIKQTGAEAAPHVRNDPQHGGDGMEAVAANHPQHDTEAQRGNPHGIRDVADVAAVAALADGNEDSRTPGMTVLE